MLAAGLALQLAFGIVFAWGTVVPLIRAAEHWSPALLGAVFSATPVGYGAGTAIGGRLADRLPPRRLCWTAMGLLALGFGLAFAFPTGLTFVVGYAFLGLGLGGGLGLSGTVAALVQIYPGRAGTVVGAASAAYASSAVFQAPLIGALAPQLGWIGALRAVGLSMAIVAALLLAQMPGLPARAVGSSARPRLLRSRAVWTGALLALCGATFGSFAAVNLGAEAMGRHLGAGLAAAAIGVFAVGNAMGRLVAGLAADRLGVPRVVLVVFLLELTAAGLLFMGGDAAGLLVAAAAAGGGLGADAGVLGRVGVDAAPHRPNSAFGLVFAGFTAGACLGPLAGALVGAPSAWLVMAAPALAGLALLAARPRLVARTA